LRAIDSSRVYSNFGPLALSFEESLAERFGLSDGTITTVANATLGLTLAIFRSGRAAGDALHDAGLDLHVPPLMPRRWRARPTSPISTPNAWALGPEGIADVIAAESEPSCRWSLRATGRLAAWDRFRSRTGLPVVVDAAASFNAITPSA
jgi:hypothetical protein